VYARDSVRNSANLFLEIGGHKAHGSCYNELMDTASPILIDREMQGGTPCFVGTRVPVRSLFDAIERGSSLEAFLTLLFSSEPNHRPTIV
jgi:hypothetical protein